MAVLRNGKSLPHGNAGSSPAYAKPLFSEQEMDKLNLLVGTALIDSAILERLLRRDIELREEFDLAETTWQFIDNAQATSLEDLCQLIMLFSQSSLLL